MPEDRSCCSAALAGINSEGEVAPQPESYRIWLVLADLKSGKIVGKATARAAVDGIDLTPAPFFKDSPAWTEDRYIDAYLETCGGKLGDPIDPVYLDGILTAAWSAARSRPMTLATTRKPWICTPVLRACRRATSFVCTAASI